MPLIDFSSGYPRFGMPQSPITFAGGFPQMGASPINFPIGANPPPPVVAQADPPPAPAVSEPPNDPSLPAPQFGISTAPSSFDIYRNGLGGQMRGGAATSGQAPSSDRLREMFGADIGGRRVSLPQIFNGGVEQSPLDSLAARPAASAPSLSQELYDASRVAGNPHEIAALRHAIIGRHNQNIDLQNEQRNMGSGLFTVPRAEVVGRYGVNPAQAGGVAGMGAATDRLNAETNAQQARDRLPIAIIAQGGGPQEAADAVEALRTANMPPGSPGSGPSQSALHHSLDQHLQTAAGLAPQQGAGRIPVALPATMGSQDANKAITNFVHSVSSAGLLTPENLPAVMSYMTQRMRSNNVDPWFAARFGGLSGGVGSAHHAAVQQLQDVMRNRGVNIGNTERPGRIGGILGDVGQSIRSLFGG